MLWFTPYDHWLTITIVMTMQPYFGLTYTRVLQRIAGTVAGGLVAALVGVDLHDADGDRASRCFRLPR